MYEMELSGNRRQKFTEVQVTPESSRFSTSRRDTTSQQLSKNRSSHRSVRISTWLWIPRDKTNHGFWFQQFANPVLFNRLERVLTSRIKVRLFNIGVSTSKFCPCRENRAKKKKERRHKQFIEGPPSLKHRGRSSNSRKFGAINTVHPEYESFTADIIHFALKYGVSPSP